jgi:hypothetical protein
MQPSICLEAAVMAATAIEAVTDKVEKDDTGQNKLDCAAGNDALTVSLETTQARSIPPPKTSKIPYS